LGSSFRSSLAGQATALWAITAAMQVLVHGAVAVAVGAERLRTRLAQSAGAQIALLRQVALLPAGTAAWTLVRSLAA